MPDRHRVHRYRGVSDAMDRVGVPEIGQSALPGVTGIAGQMRGITFTTFGRNALLEE